MNENELRAQYDLYVLRFIHSDFDAVYEQRLMSFEEFVERYKSIDS